MACVKYYGTSLGGEFFYLGSEVIAEICTNYGHILSMKVKNPEKFK